MPSLIQRRTAATFALLACAACGGESSATDPANGTGSTKNWAFTMALSKNSFTIEQGATDTIVATITRTGGFTGAVTLQAFTPPGGLTVVIENISTTGVVTSARVIVTVGGAYPTGTGVAFGLAAVPSSNEVMGTSVDVTLSVVRKPGVFVNLAPTLSVGRGQTGSTRVSIVRTSFDALVPMSLATTVAGITATYSPNPIVDTVTQMSISVASTVAEGTYSVGVRANEGLPGQATAPLTLTVTAPGTIALAFPLNPLIVRVGTSTPTALNITRTNYSAPVSIAVSGLPAGVTAAFGNPAPGNTVSINFSAAASAVPGSYPLTFTGSGVGLTNATATLTLQVTP